MLGSVRFWGAAMLVAGGAIGISAASALSEAPRQTYREHWTTTRPSSSFGRSFTADFVRPGDPDGKPHAIERILVTLHPGTRFDTAAVPRCGASDAELIASGAAACPATSKVGEDTLLADTGLPGPGRFITAESDIFNGNRELIFLAQETQSGARLVVRGRVEGNTLDIAFPFFPGSPPDGAAFKHERATFYERSTRRRGKRVAFLTTPRACPSSGSWVNRVTYTYRDGVKQTAHSRSPCIRGSRGTRPRLGLRLSGRRSRHGRRRCFRGPVRAAVVGRDRRLVTRGEFFIGRRRVARDRRPPLSRLLDRLRHRGRSHVHLARARVRLSDGWLVGVRRRYRICAERRER